MNLRVGRERAQRLALLETHFQRLKAVESILSSRSDLESSLAHTAGLATATDALRSAFDASLPLQAHVGCSYNNL